MPLKEHLWEKHPGGKTLLLSKRSWEPGLSICLFVNFRELAFLKVVGSCSTAHSKLNQKEKDVELQRMARNSQRTQEPA